MKKQYFFDDVSLRNHSVGADKFHGDDSVRRLLVNKALELRHVGVIYNNP